MILGIGTDMVDRRRIAETWKRFGRQFEQRILTEHEQELFARQQEPEAFLAKRFAVKEAASKALGTGMRGGVGWRDFELFQAANKKPGLRFFGQAAKELQERHGGVQSFQAHVSYSDEQHWVIAFVVLERLPE